ncbi:MAG: helix-turn-helix transcriptional regulator [Clostridia bacterium]|nr:helix-turn-helix transcriptional regulator [Clostridia bacterium]
METHLPIIFSAGQFHSCNKFSDPDKYPDSYVTKLRTVIDFEIELFSKDGGISHINGKSYPIKKGALLIVEPGDKRRSTLHFSALFLHFGTGDKAIRDLIHSVSGFHYGLDYEKWEPIFSDICNTALQFEQDSSIYAAAKLISFLCSVKQECNTVSDPNQNSHKYSVISEAIDYIKRTYTEAITVNDIAKHSCASVSYLHKIFVETVHTTPSKYLLDVRLAAAKSLLTTTSMPMSEIASKSGFNSQAYFSDCFNRHFGISPKEFRSSFLDKTPC